MKNVMVGLKNFCIKQVLEHANYENITLAPGNEELWRH